MSDVGKEQYGDFGQDQFGMAQQMSGQGGGAGGSGGTSGGAGAGASGGGGGGSGASGSSGLGGPSLSAVSTTAVSGGGSVGGSVSDKVSSGSQLSGGAGGGGGASGSGSGGVNSHYGGGGGGHNSQGSRQAQGMYGGGGQGSVPQQVMRGRGWGQLLVGGRGAGQANAILTPTATFFLLVGVFDASRSFSCCGWMVHSKSMRVAISLELGGPFAAAV